MKKIITIDYEPGHPTRHCSECPAFNETKCEYLDILGIDCDKVTINNITIKDE